jgi:hypothetical protein
MFNNKGKLSVLFGKWACCEKALHGSAYGKSWKVGTKRVLRLVSWINKKSPNFR